MSSQHDASDFVDSDFQSPQKTSFAHAPVFSAAPPAPDFNRPPSREEVDSKMSETQIKLGELKRAQEELERERAALEETRRRQIEFQTGREEMLQNLTRGLGLLEEAEFAARRDASQMATSLADLQEAMKKVQAINDQSWTKENFGVELTRALTTIENARMEWNSARLKFAVLSGTDASEKKAEPNSVGELLTTQSTAQLFKIGLALTWPLVVLGLGIFVVLLFLLKH